METIDSKFDESLQEIQEFLRQPSISGTGAGINRTAHLVTSKLQNLGFDTKLYPTSNNPIIMGTYQKAGSNAPTLLIQASVDVMAPVGEAWWSVPPFSATLKDHSRFGPSLIARGAYTQKASLLALLLTIEAIQTAKQELPINLIIVIDTDEEIGSPNLLDFVTAHKEELARADAVFYPLFASDRRGVARLFLGTKGVVFLRLRCQGPSTRDLHSAEVGWIRNPAHILAKALASLVDIHGHPLLPTLLDDVIAPSPEDERLIRQLADSFDPGIAALQLDAGNLTIEADSKEDLLRRFLFKPTVNISGIHSGYVGDCMKTILPREAIAHVDIRLTPNEKPDTVLKIVKDHFDNLGLSEIIDVELGYTMDWAKSSEDTPIAKALLKSYYEAGIDRVEVWPMFPSSVPLYVYANPPLNLPFVIGGLGHGGHAHGRDEYVIVEGIRQFQKGFVYFVNELSRLLKSTSGDTQ